MDKQLARQQYEQEKITKELQEAREKEEKKQESLPLEEVVSQMGSGMIHFPDGPGSTVFSKCSVAAGPNRLSAGAVSGSGGCLSGK